MDTHRLSQTVQPLLVWFQAHARTLPWRADREPYHVWLSEIMLQQTRVEAVRGYYARFLAAAPDVFALAALPEAQLLKLWEGLGYYNRARKAQACAQEVAARGGVWPDTVEDLLALPGIGPYTAGAIASICFERPAAAVDGNVLRVCARVLDDATPIDSAAHKAALTAALSACYPAGHCGDFTQALMELGATVCGPNRAPQCEVCPIAALCLARAHGTAAALPVKAPKRAKRAEDYTVFCLRCGDRLAVERRPEHGLLAGLWELPNTPGLLDERQAGEYASGQGLGDVRLRSARRQAHLHAHRLDDALLHARVLGHAAALPLGHAGRAARGDLAADGVPAVCGRRITKSRPCHVRQGRLCICSPLSARSRRSGRGTAAAGGTACGGNSQTPSRA